MLLWKDYLQVAAAYRVKDSFGTVTDYDLMHTELADQFGARLDMTGCIHFDTPIDELVFMLKYSKQV